MALCLIAAMGWWIQDYIPKTIDDASDKSSKLADYSMDTFTLTATNEQGKPHYQLTATTMKHYPNHEYAYLTKPFITFYRENESPWEVRSENGKVSEDGKIVHLTGKVNIVRSGSQNNQAVTIDTSNLTVHTDSGLAETSEKAYIKGENSKLAGVGMQAYLNDSRLRLLSNVRGTHFYNQGPGTKN